MNLSFTIPMWDDKAAFQASSTLRSRPASRSDTSNRFAQPRGTLTADEARRPAHGLLTPANPRRDDVRASIRQEPPLPRPSILVARTTAHSNGPRCTGAAAAPHRGAPQTCQNPGAWFFFLFFGVLEMPPGNRGNFFKPRRSEGSRPPCGSRVPPRRPQRPAESTIRPGGDRPKTRCRLLTQ